MTAPNWRKAQDSTANGNCVELTVLDSGEIGIRDSKHPEDPYLTISQELFAALLREAKSGALDGYGLPETP